MFGGYQPMTNIMGIEEGLVRVVIDRGGERGVTGYVYRLRHIETVLRATCARFAIPDIVIVLCTVCPFFGLLASIFS